MIWTGSDPDGYVTGYELAWYTGVFSGDEYDTLGWQYTTSKDSTFLLRADSSCNGGVPCRDHTFFVRAVDNAGGRDDTPAHVSFTATTKIPKTTITYPDWPYGVFADTLAPCVTVRWRGDDDDGNVVAYRYKWKRYNDPPWQEPPHPDEPGWSQWDPATSVTWRLVQTEPDNPWSIAIQAKDDAGAVETVFKPGDNFIVIYVNEEWVNLPLISVCCVEGTCMGKPGKSLGCRSTADTTQMEIPIGISVGDTVCFTTAFSPGKYATEVTDIAFKFNDSTEPGSWLDAGREGNTIYPADGGIFMVPPGINVLYVWVRDDYCDFGSTRRAEIRIEGQF
jgi:hypothetical protein